MGLFNHDAKAGWYLRGKFPRLAPALSSGITYHWHSSSFPVTCGRICSRGYVLQPWFLSLSTVCDSLRYVRPPFSYRRSNLPHCKLCRYRDPKEATGWFAQETFLSKACVLWALVLKAQAEPVLPAGGRSLCCDGRAGNETFVERDRL